MMAVNNRTASLTGLLPFFMTHGYHAQIVEARPIPELEGSPKSPAELGRQWVSRWTEAAEFAQAAMAAAQEVQERHANESRQSAEALRVGDRVWLRLKNFRTDRPSKKLD